MKIKHNLINNIKHLLFGHLNFFNLWIKYTEHDGASQHAICMYCGKKGMFDSQGNLF